MSNLLKRVLSLAVALIMIIGMIPVTSLAAEVSASITFNSTAKRTSFSTSAQVWEENDITVTNNKASSTSNVADYSNPARFYKSSQLIVEYVEPMTKIVFDCNSTSYATALQTSIGSPSGATLRTYTSVFRVMPISIIRRFTAPSPCSFTTFTVSPVFVSLRVLTAFLLTP